METRGEGLRRRSSRLHCYESKRGDYARVFRSRENGAWPKLIGLGYYTCSGTGFSRSHRAVACGYADRFIYYRGSSRISKEPRVRGNCLKRMDRRKLTTRDVGAAGVRVCVHENVERCAHTNAHLCTVC